jgi:YVTN family beta-propeller protein
MTGADSGAGSAAGPGWKYDVALSFAGAQREYVGQVATALKARGVSCFYDADERVQLWGTQLAEELPRIYERESRMVVVFISEDYTAGKWTRLERRAAFSRAVTEAGVYVLPARFDDSELPGLLRDTVFVDLRGLLPGQFAELVADKLAEADAGLLLHQRQADRKPPPARATGSTPTARATPANHAQRLILLAGTAAIITAVLLIYQIISGPRPSANSGPHPPSNGTRTAGNSPPATTFDPITHAPASPAVHAAANTVTTTIGLGSSSALAVAVDPDTRTAYVTAGGSVSVIDTTKNTVTATIGVGQEPDGVAVDPATHTAYVTNGSSGSVSVIDTDKDTVTATIAVGQDPVGVAVDPVTHTAYVANAGGYVSVIDTDAVTDTVSVGQGPDGVAVDPATHTAYVTNGYGDSVSVIDTDTDNVTATIAVGQAPTGVAVNPDTHTAYVINTGGGSVSVIDTDAVTATVAVGQDPVGVAVDPATHTAYVTNEYGGPVGSIGSVSVINIG